MKNLFGDEVSDIALKMSKRTDKRHPCSSGTGPKGETCGTCGHRVKVRYHGKAYNKCGVLKGYWTHGPGTDLKCKDEACSMWHNCIGGNMSKEER